MKRTTCKFKKDKIIYSRSQFRITYDVSKGNIFNNIFLSEEITTHKQLKQYPTELALIFIYLYIYIYISIHRQIQIYRQIDFEQLERGITSKNKNFSNQRSFTRDIICFQFDYLYKLSHLKSNNLVSNVTIGY